MSGATEDILKKQLLKDYNKGTAPPWVVVQHQLSVWQIQEVSTEHQRMSFQVYVAHELSRWYGRDT